MLPDSESLALYIFLRNQRPEIIMTIFRFKGNAVLHCLSIFGTLRSKKAAIQEEPMNVREELAFCSDSECLNSHYRGSSGLCPTWAYPQTLGNVISVDIA